MQKKKFILALCAMAWLGHGFAQQNSQHYSSSGSQATHSTFAAGEHNAAQVFSTYTSGELQTSAHYASTPLGGTGAGTYIGVKTVLWTQQEMLVIQPNPATTSIQLVTGSSAVSVRICALNGQTVLAVSSYTGFVDINIEDFIPGMYLVVVQSASGTKSGMLLKQ